jgi:hypothetical protein
MEHQITPAWRKSTYSSGNGGNCVELGCKPGAVFVRDTKDNGRGPVLQLSVGDWKRFTVGIKH